MIKEKNSGKESDITGMAEKWWEEVSKLTNSNEENAWKARREKLKHKTLTVEDVNEAVTENNVHNLLQDIFLEPIWEHDVEMFQQIVYQGKVKEFIKYWNSHRGFRCSYVLKKI